MKPNLCRFAWHGPILYLFVSDIAETVVISNLYTELIYHTTCYSVVTGIHLLVIHILLTAFSLLLTMMMMMTITVSSCTQ